MKEKRRKWSSHETRHVVEAVDKIEAGASIYSQIKELKQGWLSHRSWEAIRSQLWRIRGVRNARGEIVLG